MWHQRFNRNFTKLWVYAKKTKITTFIQQFSTPTSPFWSVFTERKQSMLFSVSRTTRICFYVYLCFDLNENNISVRWVKFRLSPWCHMDYLPISLLRFWTLIVLSTLLSTEGQRALRFHQKYLNLCSEYKRRYYEFGTTWGWVINYIFFILGWSNPLTLL